LPEKDSELPVGEGPILAFAYHPRSFAAMAIAEASRDLCNLLWLVDTGDTRVGSTSRLLARLGTVVDIAGLDPHAAAVALAPYRVDGVLALADDLLEWTAKLAEILALPFHTPEGAHRLTDKYAQRSAFRSAGLAAPGSWIVSATSPAADWSKVRANATFPVVAKPRHGEGSRNTLIAHSVDEARAVIDEPDESASARDWVLEEYIADIDHPVCGDGFANYVSVESCLVDGRPHHLAVTGRTPPATPFRETGFFIPAEIDTAVAEDLFATAGRAIAAIGSTIGCFHTEIKLTPAGPVVIEVNGRIGGGIPELLDLTAGFDFLRSALKIALRLPVEPLSPRFSGVGFLLYVQAPDDIHTITAVDGLASVGAMPDVRDVTLNRGPGERVDWRDGNHGYVYSVLGATSDYDGLRSDIDRISTLAHIHGR
jgi:biotin carboxylase